jgi:hypothetical protein
MAELPINVGELAGMENMTVRAVYDENGDDTIVTGIKITNPYDVLCTLDFKPGSGTEADPTRIQIVSPKNATELFSPPLTGMKIYWNPGVPHEEGAHTIYFEIDGLDGNGEPVGEVIAVCQDMMSG